MQRNLVLSHSGDGRHFGPFDVDIASGTIRKGGIKLHLRKKSFEVLTLLLQHPGEIITRTELRDRLWPANGLSDADNSLNVTVARVREVLGDSARTAKYVESVETMAGSGYRFVGHLSDGLSALEKEPWARPA